MSRPLQNSITMKNVANAWKRSYTRATFACVSRSTMSSSRWKRAMAGASNARRCDSIFRATTRSSLTRSAR